MGFLWKEVERTNISTFARARARRAALIAAAGPARVRESLLSFCLSLARARAIETFLESADE